MERDIVCGKSITDERLHSALYRDHRFVFCSLDCKRNFEQAPETFIEAAQRQGETPLPSRSMVDGPAVIQPSSGTTLM
jgi:YHS domain-containing protein